MFVLVDLEDVPPSVRLAEADDCGRFHVAVHGNGHAPAVDDALAAAGAGWLDGDGDAMVEVAAVRAMAEGQVDAEWEQRFTAMLEYAATKGWLSDDGSTIRAHLEWG